MPQPNHIGGIVGFLATGERRGLSGRSVDGDADLRIRSDPDDQLVPLRGGKILGKLHLLVPTAGAAGGNFEGGFVRIEQHLIFIRFLKQNLRTGGRRLEPHDDSQHTTWIEHAVVRVREVVSVRQSPPISAFSGF